MRIGFPFRLVLVVAILVLLLPPSGAARAEDLPELHPVLEPEFQQELNAKTNSVLAVSDEIRLLVNGKESYPVRWKMLEDAKKSIHFTTMYIFRDATTKKLGDLLIRKKNEGVDIKMIVYGPYATGNPFFYRKMRENGIGVKMYSSVPDVLLHFYQPKRFWKRHLHDKYLVVDGEQAIVGGMNWSGRYERGGTGQDVAWRDTDMWVRGPQAEIIEKEFQKRWLRDESPEQFKQVADELDALYLTPIYPTGFDLGALYTPDPSVPYGYRVKNLTRFIYQQPFEHDGQTHMTIFYKEVMDRAKSHIWWQSISIRPAAVQTKALLDAAARGVDVRLMTNSLPNMRMIPIGGLPLYYITRSDYEELLKGGVRIFEYYGDAPMHAKGFLVDDVVAIIGSYNATFTAERYYTEDALVTYDTDSVRDVRKMLEDDLAQCKEVTLEDL